MNPATIRTNLKTQLEANIAGLHVYEDGYSHVTIPAALIIIDDLDYQLSMGGSSGPLTKISISLVVCVGKADEKGALSRLDGYSTSSGALSVRAALAADRTLAGAVNHITLRSRRNVGQVTIREGTFFGAEFVLEAHGR